jgi:hypothetical protein
MEAHVGLIFWLVSYLLEDSASTVNVTQEFDEILCSLQNVASIWIPVKNHKGPLN